MASLFNTKISNTYVGLLKMSDNLILSSSLREISDGSGNGAGVYLNTSGDLKATGILEFGSLKDTGENITITKFVDEADGIANNDNDTSIPTSGAIIDYVASRITLEDLDFSGDSGTGSVDLDSQTFAIVGTANEIETSAGSQQLQIGLPSNVTITSNLQINGLLKGNNNIVIKDTSDRTMAAFYGGNKSELYFNDSKKFETTSDGATITGGLTATASSTFTSASFSGTITGNVTGNVTGDLTGNVTGNVTGVGTLSDGSTAVTQSQDDNSTKIATTAYVDAGLASQDTLGEVLGVGNTTDGTDIRVTGGADITFVDNGKAKFGDGNDLEIYHDASNSYISDQGTGELKLLSSSVAIQSASGGEYIAYFAGTGGQTASLYAGNSKKFETSSTGITVTGVVTSDGLDIGDAEKIQLGNANDLQIRHLGGTGGSYIENYSGDLYITNFADDKGIIFQSDNGSGGSTEYFKVDGLNENIRYSVPTVHIDNKKAFFGTAGDLAIYHDGSNSYIQETGTGNLYIDATSSIIFRDYGSAEEMAKFINDGAIELFYDNSKKFSTTTSGIDITGASASDSILVNGGADARVKVLATTTGARLDLQTDSHHRFLQTIESDGRFRLYNQTSATEQIAVSSSGDTTFYGDISVVKDVPSIDLVDTNSDDDFRIRNNNGVFEVLDTTNTGVRFKIDSDGHSQVTGNLQVDGNQVITGDLTVNGTTTTVNTEHFNVEDPLISMAKDNAANTVDIGFYGRYNDGSNKYLGLYADASDSNTFKLFKGTGTEPTTTVDSSASGYVLADLKLAALTTTGNIVTSGNITLNSKLTFDYGGDHYFEAGTNSLSYKSSTGSSVITLNASTLDTSFAGTVQGKAFRTETGSTDYSLLTRDSSNTAVYIQQAGTGNILDVRYGSQAAGQGTSAMVVNSSGNVGMGGTGIYTTVSTLNLDGEGISIKNDRNGSNNNWSYIRNTGILSTANLEFVTGVGTSLILNHDKSATFSDDVKINDDKKLNLGTDEDLKLYHDNTNGYITNSTGILNINNNDIRFKTSGDETMLRAVANGAVELMYDNSTKFSTTSSGVQVDGTILHSANSRNTFIGSASSYSIVGSSTYDNNIHFLTYTSGGVENTNQLVLDANSRVGIGVSDPVVPLHVKGTAVNNPSNGNGGYEVMQIFDDTAFTDGVGGGIGFGGNFTSSNSTIFSEIRGIKENNTDSNYAGALKFSTRANGGNITERMRIASDGLITFPTVSEVRGDISSGKFAIGNMGDASSQMMVSSRGFITFNTSNTGAAVDATERVRISDIGRVAIGGTTTSANTLTLQGTGTELDLTNTSTNGRQFRLTPTASGDFEFIDKTANVERFRIDANGHFGIAVSPTGYYGDQFVVKAPDENGITIASSGADQKQYICFADGTSGAALYTGYIAYDHNDDSMTFATNGGGQKVKIESDGKFIIAADDGIPTQITGIASGGQELRMRQSRGTINSPTNSSANGDGNYITSYTYASSAYTKIGQIGIITGSATNNGDITFGTATSGTIKEKMRLSSGSEIIIGTGTDNAGFLDFDGNNLQFNTQRNPNTGAFVDTSKTHAHIGLRGGTSGSEIVFGTTNSANTVATTRMDIDPNGALQFKGAESGVTGVRFQGSGTCNGYSGSLASFYVMDVMRDQGSGKSMNVQGTIDIANGYGIGFGASAGSGATSTLLDDYEEGTWTPVLKFDGATTGITYSTQAGVYTKVGRIVTFSLRIILTSKGSATGTATIEGLPFTSANITANYGSCMLAFATNIGIQAKTMFTIDSNTSIIRPRYVNTTTYSNYTTSQFQDNSDIILTGVLYAT